MLSDPEMIRSATFSEDRIYRYSLERVWHKEGQRLMVVGLNPSTADETVDDRTITRVIGYARLWGYGGLVMTNIFGYRSTDPKKLKVVEDPEGPDNISALVLRGRETWTGGGMVLAAWGTNGALLNQGEKVADLLSRTTALWCLGTTKQGHPGHPLYLGKDLKPLLYRASKRETE